MRLKVIQQEIVVPKDVFPTLTLETPNARELGFDPNHIGIITVVCLILVTYVPWISTVLPHTMLGPEIVAS